MPDAFGSLAPAMPGVPVQQQQPAMLPHGMRSKLIAAITGQANGAMPADPSDQAAMQPETFVPPALADWNRQAAPKDVGIARGILNSAATLPQRAIEATANWRPGDRDSPFDPGPILEAATLPLGTGVVAGLPMRAGETVLGAGLIPKGTTKAEWRALRQQRVEGREALAKIENAMHGPAPEHVDPFAGMNDQETADAFERILRATAEPSQNLQSRITDAVRAGGGTGVRISDVAAKLPDVPLEDIHAEMMNMQKGDQAVLSNWDDPRSTTAAMKAAAINVGGDPRHVISLVQPRP